MIYPITVYGDPILRKKALPVERGHDGLMEIVEGMWETMYSSEGVGLAAPQIGLSLRIFIVDATSGADEEPELINFKRVFINPEIIERGGEEWIMTEGCLSIPEIREDVKRPDRVLLRYFDESFNEYEEEFDGFAGRIIQHEFDHLEGVLFIDYLTPLKKRLLKGKLRDIYTGKVIPHYKIKIPVK